MIGKPGIYRDRLRPGRWRRLQVLLLTGLVAAGCAATVREAAPERTAVDPASIRPGLAVLYFDDFYRNIDEMPTAAALKEGRPGKPIPFLNYRFDSGPVFGSGRSRGVGVQMTGFIRFPAAGNYQFQARSNDGIRIFIDGEKIIDDPDVHSDRYSPKASVQIDRAGWYPLRVQYFQRKGTAMLELYWQPPGRSDFEIVPAEAFGHAARSG